MFRKRNVKGQARKRKIEESDGSDDSDGSTDSNGTNGSEPIVQVKFIKRTVKQPTKEALEAKRVPEAKRAPEEKKGSTGDEDHLVEVHARSRKTLFEGDRLQEEEFALKEKDLKEQAEQKAGPQKTSKDGAKIYTGTSKKVDKWKPAPVHIKTNTVVDYQPDVCKDFLKNGYCGYGDNCKFLHYREEYKTVKDNDKPKEWEAVAKRHKKW